jgi:low affinity Fe/Cu permease
MKIVVALAFVAIFASLGSALFFMLRGGRSAPGDGEAGDAGDAGKKRMAWALTVRIAVSVLVFLCILLAWKLGYIQPHGIQVGQ